MSLARVLVAASLGTALAGCGSCSEETPPGGTPLVVRISAAEQLITGVEATGKTGDWLLANDRVRFVVQDAGSGSGWGLYGGTLVDVDRVHSEADPVRGDDRLQEIFFQCDLRGFEPTAAEVIDEGRGGTPAVLRFTGRDRGIPLVDTAAATQDLEVAITVDYVLAPGSDTLEVRMSAKDVRKKGSRELACGMVLLPGDSLRGFVDGHGWRITDATDAIPYIAAAAHDASTSYAVYRKAGPMLAALPQGEVLPLSGENRSFPTGGSLEETFYVSVGDGDVESVLAARRRVVGDPDAAARREVRVRVTAPEMMRSRLGAVLLTFHDRSKPPRMSAVTAARVDPSTGLAAAAVLPGTYDVEVSLEAKEMSRMTIEVAPGAGPVEAAVELGGRGLLVVRSVLTDRAGAELGPTASKLRLVRGLDAPAGGPAELEQYLMPADELLVPPGDYTAYVSRGPEVELHRQNVTVPSLGRVEIDARLARVVDTAGWIAVDLHVHSAKSVDADALRRVRVIGAIAEGLDVLAATDHDVVTDYAPTVRELGLEGRIGTISGIEISPPYGHMNAFGLPVMTPERYWQVSWFTYGDDRVFDRLLDPHEIVRDLRASTDVKFIQVNHGRTGAGVFDYIRYDPVTGASAKEFPAVDGFEVINSKRADSFDLLLRDMTSFHRHNRRLTATGASDAHGIFGVGYARTYVKSEEDDGARVSEEALYRALREGRAIAATGPFATLRAESGSVRGGIGDTLALPAGGAPVRLMLDVQAPSWMDVSTYTVLDGDVVLASGPIPPAGGVTRLDLTVTATPAKDSFYLLLVEGSPGSRNDPVMGARARAVTNPIFVDVGGDGLHFD